MSPQARVLAGVPTGGRWATASRPEIATSLAAPAPGTRPVRPPRPVRPSGRSLEHAALADLGVPAGALSLLAPVEAKTVLGSLTRADSSSRAAVRKHVDAYLRWRDVSASGPVGADRARRIFAEATSQHEAAVAGFTAAQTVADRRRDPDALMRLQEAQDDLVRAVRRKDSAAEDLRYLSDPSWRESARWGRPLEPGSSAEELLARMSARRRFADPAYRGQVH